MKQFFFLAWAWCLILEPLTALGDEDKAKSDLALLEILHAAQLTNRGLFPVGELTAKVDSLWDGSSIKLSAKVVWSGESTYWSYLMIKQDQAGESRDRCEMIDDGKTLVGYWPEARFVQRIHDRKLSRHELLSLRPDEVWFRLEGIKEWSSLLEPTILSDRPNDSTVQVAVERLTNDLVRVERRHATGETLRIVASMAANGNVVEYEGTPGKASSIWRKGTYRWANDSAGRCFLKGYDYERAVNGNKSSPDRTFHLVVESFKPDGPISSSRFDVSSLNIPEDATVDDVSASGSRIYRKSRPTVVNEQLLIELSRKLGERGFGTDAKE